MTAATDLGSARMRVSKAVGLFGRDGDALPGHFVVLDEPGGDRHLVIEIGDAEAFALAANLSEVTWGRPMTYQLMAELLRCLGGQIREVRLDALVDSAYAATIVVAGPAGVELVDARSSDALNLAVLVGAPVWVAPEVLADCSARQEGESPEAVSLRRALAAPPMMIRQAAP